MKNISILIVIVSVMSLSAPAFGSAAGGSDGSVLADALFVRPVGLAAVVVGTAVFIVGLPFTIPTGSVGVAARALISDPFNYTFCRPIGEGPQAGMTGAYADNPMNPAPPVKR